MNIGEIEENIRALASGIAPDSFIYDLLAAYGLPKASITRLQQGAYNLSKAMNEILWKKKLYFKAVLDEDLHAFIDTRRKQPDILKHAPRFVVTTDFKTLLAFDNKTHDTLDIPIADLPRRFDFFLPWAGMERTQAKAESQADVKAAFKMGKLYDLIRADNPELYTDGASLHDLNVFLCRLLFCYFAEDTEFFQTNFSRIASLRTHRLMRATLTNTSTVSSMCSMRRTKLSWRPPMPILFRLGSQQSAFSFRNI
jgi:hypothetical protein